MLWRMCADTHVRIGTLPNSSSPSDRTDRLDDNESAAAAVNGLGSGGQGDVPGNARGPTLSDGDSLLSDSSLMTILRKEENAASNYQWSALSRTREDALNYYDRKPYGDEQ